MFQIRHGKGWLGYSGIIIALFLMTHLSGCGTIGKKSASSKTQVPQEDKYGKLKGPFYFNEYYRFQITTPRGWQAGRPKTETVVRMTPVDKEFKIEITVWEGATDSALDGYLRKIIKKGGYELQSQESTTFLESPALLAELKSTGGVMDLKKKVMLVQRYNNLYQISSIGPFETFSRYEQSFDEALESFRFTDTLMEGLGEYDYFTYMVKPNDTLKDLATRFLNDPSEAVSISHFNQMTTLIAYRKIDIPRYRTYKVREGATKAGLSKKFYNSFNYFYLIPPYNAQISEDDLLKPGTVIRVPMYFLYTVKPGDGLPALALRYLRSEDRAKLISLYNSPETIRVGSIIKIPILWAERDFIIYTVQPDDSLSSIAEQFLGSVNNFPVLAEFNNIQPPFEISVGQQIKIPKDMIKERPKPRTTKKKPPKQKEVEDEFEDEFEDELDFDDEEIEGPIYEPE